MRLRRGGSLRLVRAPVMERPPDGFEFVTVDGDILRINGLPVYVPVA